VNILFIGLVDISLNKGSSIHTRELVENLRRRGNEVKLIAQASKEIKFHNFYNTGAFLNHKNDLVRFFYLLISVVRALFYIFIYAKEADVIYVRDSMSLVLSCLPKRIYKKWIVYEVNGLAHEERRLHGRYLLNRLYIKLLDFVEKIAIRNSDKIIAVTSKIKEYIKDRYGIDNVVVIGNGVNTSLFYPIRDKEILEGLRRKLRIEMDDYVVGFIGSLSPWQGLEYLVLASSNILSEIPNTRFLIVGDGVKRREIEDRINRLGLKDKFIFIGEVAYEDASKYINISDVCIALYTTPRNEKVWGSPLKMYGYMACGKPVIGTRTPGLEIIEKKRVGILVEPEDPKGLYEGIMSLIKDKGLRKRFGENGIRLASENSWEIISAKVEEILRKDE